jgi:hypothetical protein
MLLKRFLEAKIARVCRYDAELTIVSMRALKTAVLVLKKVISISCRNLTSRVERDAMSSFEFAKNKSKRKN